jgi:hypothetical protein
MTQIDPSLLYDAYHNILQLGLENLRRFSIPERFDYLNIEIDHLHNIPSYMRDDNVFRHAYYFCSERPFYSSRLLKFTEFNTSWIISQYSKYWDALRVGLMPFADVINSHDYLERL